MCQAEQPQHVTVVGAGPSGALAALLLAQRGYRVSVYEGRPDPRESAGEGHAAVVGVKDASLSKVADAAKRSINLALSHRGLCALRKAGLDEAAIAAAVPMRGRMIHDKNGGMTLQPYGTRPDEILYSIGRQQINVWLLEALRKHSDQVDLHFERKCSTVRADGSADFVASGAGVKGGERGGGIVAHAPPGRLLGCDGAFSAVRAGLSRLCRLSVSVDYIEHGYKELHMPAAKGGGYAMPPEALHIWPGSEAMLIALPNSDGSFTCTLFGDFTLLESFTTAAAATAFFESLWPDTLTLIPDIAVQYLRNPNAALSTVRCAPWNFGGKLLLIGDAAHGVVPFYGQGLNCAFEDVDLLDAELERCADDWEEALPKFYQARKPAADALARLALDNYVEMRDKTVDRLFLLKNTAHGLLHSLFGERWQPSLHTAVSFTSMPYHEAMEACANQDRWLVRSAAVVAALGIGGAVAIVAKRR